MANTLAPVRQAMKARVSRVSPTPVARAKQRDGKSRSKSVTVEYSDSTARRAPATSAPFSREMMSQMRARI